MSLDQSAGPVDPDRRLFHLLSLVKNEESRRRCYQYRSLYQLISTGSTDGHYQPESDDSMINSQWEDPIKFLELAEWYLYGKKRDEYERVMGALEAYSKRTLLDVNDDPLFLHNRISLLHGMSGVYPKHLLETIDLAMILPQRARETNGALLSLACAVVEYIHLAGFKDVLLPRLLQVLRRISKKTLRDEASALVSRKLLLRDEIVPPSDPELIEFARKELIPSIYDKIELDYTEVQLAVALNKIAVTEKGDTREQYIKESIDIFSRLRARIEKLKDRREGLLLQFNLLRGFAQCGLIKEARGLKGLMMADFYKGRDSANQTLSMITQTKMNFNNRLPSELRNLESELVDMLGINQNALCSAIILSGRYSSEDEFSKGCFRDSENAIEEVPFIDLKLELLMQLASARAFRGNFAEGKRLYAMISTLTERFSKKEAIDFFKGRFTDSIGDTFSCTQDGGFLDIWINLATKLKVRSSDLDSSIEFLFNSIYSHSRGRKWKIAFIE